MRRPQRANKSSATASRNGRKGRRASSWGRVPMVNSPQNSARQRRWKEEDQS